jgi:hypothetical protein
MADNFDWSSAVSGVGNAAINIADVLAKQRQAQSQNDNNNANQAVSEKMAKALLKQKEQELQQSAYQQALQGFISGLSSQVEAGNASRSLQKQNMASFNDILAKAFLRG